MQRIAQVTQLSDQLNQLLSNERTKSVPDLEVMVKHMINRLAEDWIEDQAAPISRYVHLADLCKTLWEQRQMESTILIPSTFMELAEQLTRLDKIVWPCFFEFYYHTGLYDRIVKNDPKFILHFTKKEMETWPKLNWIMQKKIGAEYLIAGQDSFNMENQLLTDDPENELDKAIIFLREEKYKVDRKKQPEYKHCYGRLFGYDKKSKLNVCNINREFLLSSRPLSDYSSYILEKLGGLDQISPMLEGKLRIALNPLIIHSYFSDKMTKENVEEIVVKSQLEMPNEKSLRVKY
jgi:hypothetical protein